MSEEADPLLDSLHLLRDNRTTHSLQQNLHMFVPIVKTTGMNVTSTMRHTEEFLTAALGGCQFKALLTVGHFTRPLHSTGYTIITGQPRHQSIFGTGVSFSASMSPCAAAPAAPAILRKSINLLLQFLYCRLILRRYTLFIFSKGFIRRTQSINNFSIRTTDLFEIRLIRKIHHVLPPFIDIRLYLPQTILRKLLNILQVSIAIRLFHNRHFSILYKDNR